MEDLRTKAQKVMEVLQKPEVIAVLRQDKAESIQYLKDNYQVRKIDTPFFEYYDDLTHFMLVY